MTDPVNDVTTSTGSTDPIIRKYVSSAAAAEDRSVDTKGNYLPCQGWSVCPRVRRIWST